MKLNDLTKNILLWVVIVLVMLAVFSRYMPNGNPAQQLTYSEFYNDVKAGR
jgi:cell division protease FtsH